MKRKIKIKDFEDALTRSGLMLSACGNATGDDEISGITFNSREVAAGCLFVCKGAHFKREYLDEAVAKGALCYVMEGDAPFIDGARGISVKDIRKAMPVIAETFYGRLSDDLKIIGITGTKGKSTTTYFMKYILDEWMQSVGGKESAICSSIDNYDGVIEEESHLTSPEIMELYVHMDNAVKSGIEYMSMEVSSQGLKYDRLSGVELEAGAFLNIGTDHISDIEHPDFDDYFESKLKLFFHCRRACYNLDSDELPRIREASAACPYVITFSQCDESANITAYDICSDEGLVSFKVRGRDIEGYEDFDELISLGIFGLINVENALAAIALSVLTAVPMEHIKAGLAKALVPGRMELFRSSDGHRMAIVDYAHNKLSYERFFETIGAEFPEKDIIIVFGSAGCKAYSRREELGTLAGRNCKYSIITEEDYGEEDVNKICSEIAGYVEQAGGRYEIITDREEAIRKAVSMMDENSILFVPGKGRETYLKRGNEYVDVPTDVELVEKYLK